MRSKSCCMALFGALLFSCQAGRNDRVSGAAGSDQLDQQLTGTYDGHFKEGMMTLVINYVSDSIVSGYDLHKGLRRNLNGEVRRKGDSLALILREPGNNPLDGVFYLSMDTAGRAITGKWTPPERSSLSAGPVDLKRWEKDSSDDENSGAWNGDLGTLSFNGDGSCELGYSGSGDPAGDGTTVWGIYEQKGNTIYIEWEPNKYLPSRKMTLVKNSPGEGSGNDENSGPPTLRGDGMTFERSIAG